MFSAAKIKCPCGETEAHIPIGPPPGTAVGFDPWDAETRYNANSATEVPLEKTNSLESADQAGPISILVDAPAVTFHGWPSARTSAERRTTYRKRSGKPAPRTNASLPPPGETAGLMSVWFARGSVSL